jgi:hypothetical protein
MRRLSALLLACTLILIACVPTTHASGTDPDKPVPHLTTNLETPIVADEGAWVETKAGSIQRWVLSCFRHALAVYGNPHVRIPFLTHDELEAMPSHESGQSSPTKSSGITRK